MMPLIPISQEQFEDIFVSEINIVTNIGDVRELKKFIGRKIDITLEEWNQYEWLHVGGGEYIRGIKNTNPPDDGYAYTDVTTCSDAERKWARSYYIERTRE